MMKGMARATIVRQMDRVATNIPNSVKGHHFSLSRSNHLRKRIILLHLEGSRRQAVRHLGQSARRLSVYSRLSSDCSVTEASMPLLDSMSSLSLSTYLRSCHHPFSSSMKKERITK
jgi:hypothetical protein